MKEINDDLPLESKMKIFAQIGIEGGVDPADYGYDTLRNITINTQISDRQWTYQFWTAYGWFQTWDHFQPLKWNGTNVDYWMNFWQKVFDYRFYPAVDHTNILNGGL